MEEKFLAELRPHWISLGLSDVEIQHEINDVESRIELTKLQFFNSLKENLAERKEKFRKRRDTLIDILTAMEAAHEEIEELGKIEEKLTLSQAEDKLNEIEQKCEPLIEKRKEDFKEVFAEITEKFETLAISIEERGDFAEIGKEDLTEERLNSFIVKNEELAVEVESAKNSYLEIVNRIKKILELIDVPANEDLEELFEAKIYSTENKEKLEKEEEKLKEVFDAKKKVLVDLATKITCLWDILGTPKEERIAVMNQKNLSDSALDAVREEIRKCEEEKDERIDELVEKITEEIIQLAEKLHIPEEDVNSAIERGDRTVFEHYDILSSCVSQLRISYNKSEKVLEMIEQREEILSDYKEDPKNEKAKRRKKSVLPRLEKKLLISLEEFNNKNGQNLLFEGKPYIDELSHVVVTELERSAMGKKKRKSIH